MQPLGGLSAYSPCTAHKKEKMDKEIILPDTYNKNLTCDNCSSSVGLRIPMGITVWNYAKEHKCLYCGCMLIPQDAEKYSYAEHTPSLFLPYYGLRR